jgi:hypothetical protein
MTAASFLVAAGSYELFERRFLVLKRRLMPASASVGTPLGRLP